ncbi:MAG TPA: aminotransferase class III-fold pyridoxal phosphate-dependent enzyme, partial [Hymenobacter sp.]|nr:aminotransferase class III-fold pyridoxal phosphate-dependent enzyme [Hymenobacter sp.]
ALAVLEVIEQENLVDNALQLGDYLRAQLATHAGAEEIRGRGLMVGIKYTFPIKEVRDRLLTEHRIFVGNASDPTVLRLLPPLNITNTEVDRFLQALYQTSSPSSLSKREQELALKG